MRILALILVLIVTPAQAERITVFAAASLKDALENAAREWEMRTDDEIVLSFAGSSLLARQIMQGAPAAIYISASVVWMDELEASGDVEPNSRRDLVRNRLVLLRHGRSGEPVELNRLPERLGKERLAMALVDAVPAGIYGQAALRSLGLWEAIGPRVAQADNVRAALALVARGETPFGIAYRTDAGAADDVSVAAVFPETSHPPIVYPAALVKGANAARPFLDWLSSPEGLAIFARYGFLAPR